ncbi:MAG: hypothetical protein ACRD29_03270 [Acidimicrobiales bacterium]
MTAVELAAEAVRRATTGTPVVAAHHYEDVWLRMQEAVSGRSIEERLDDLVRMVDGDVDVLMEARRALNGQPESSGRNLGRELLDRAVLSARSGR